MKIPHLDVDPPFAEGKTKCVYAIPGEPGDCVVVSKDDITARDGAKHDILPGKAAWATTTTRNAFGVLKNLHRPLPVAFEEQLSDTSFKAKLCDMLPFEVVVRHEAYGSYLKRHPNVEKGTKFYEYKCEFFLKTSGRRFKQFEFPVNDPLVVYSNDGREKVLHVHHPDKPLESDESFIMTIPMKEIIDGDQFEMLFWTMKEHAISAFILLEGAWQRVGGRLVDFKVEFGIDNLEQLLLADVIDNDSWRVMMDEQHLDKQQYRDGTALDEVAARYKLVAELTSSPNFK
ncbi:MAG: phosphoribosylaminoimidazolesuccinocarboxamide synthase [Patescibacteria group bacterium]